MEQVANPSMSYVFPVDALCGMLKAHVDWANRQAEQEETDLPPVVTYECRDFDFDTFGVVDKILNRSYVEEKEIHDAKACLDFFGPFKAENILVDLSTRICAACGKTDGKVKQCACGLVRYCNEECQLAHRKAHKNECKERIAELELERKAKEEENTNSSPVEGKSNKKARVESPKANPRSTDGLGKNIIICETEARMRAVSACARALGEPYVPFKLLFVEGVLQTGGECGVSAVDVPMMTAACLLGDYDNAFHMRGLCRLSSLEASSLEELNSKFCLFKRYPPPVVKQLLEGVSPGAKVDLEKNVEWEGEKGHRREAEQDMEDNGYGLGLKVGLVAKAGDIKSAVLDSVLRVEHGMPFGFGVDTVYLPGIGATEESDTDQEGSTLFHRNDEGKICFTDGEAERASSFIASIGLEEHVKASLQEKRFVLPQKTDKVEAHFCNESVYGNVNILWVCGAIRFPIGGGSSEPVTESSSRAEAFNVWPSQQAKARTNQEREMIAFHAQMDRDGMGMMW